MSVQMMIFHPMCGAIEMRTLVALLHKEGEGGVVWEEFKQCPPQPWTNSRYIRGGLALGSCACKISLVSANRLVPATMNSLGLTGWSKQKKCMYTWMYIHIVWSFFFVVRLSYQKSYNSTYQTVASPHNKNSCTKGVPPVKNLCNRAMAWSKGSFMPPRRYIYITFIKLDLSSGRQYLIYIYRFF